MVFTIMYTVNKKALFLCLTLFIFISLNYVYFEVKELASQSTTSTVSPSFSLDQLKETQRLIIDQASPCTSTNHKQTFVVSPLIVFVISAPGNAQARKAIRKTWGQ